MFIQQVAQVPVIFGFGNLKIAAPKFMVQDWLEWANEIDKSRKDEAVKGVPDEVRFRLLNFYTQMPTSIEELKSWVTTPSGTQRVCRICLQRARVIGESDKPDESFTPRKIKAQEIQDILSKSVHEDLVFLAKLLADVRDTSRPTDGQTKASEDEDKDKNKAFDDETPDNKPAEELDPLAENSKFA